jgi:hypothetical protein
MARLHTSIAQWGLVSGIRQEASDLALVCPPPSRFAREGRKGQLIVVVEAEGDVSRGRNACEAVAQTIQETYYGDDSVSITSSLRKALKAANAALYQFNFEAPAHKRATVGVTCAVFHGHDLFVTQVPPSQAYVAHAGKLRAMPNPMAWSGGAQSGATIGYSAALGTSLGSEAEFFRSVLQPGDTVVVTSSNIGRLLGKGQAEQLICFADAATVAEGLYELCRRSHLPEAHAVVIEIMPELSAEARHAPLSPAGVSERGKLAAGRLGDWFSMMGSEARRTLQTEKARPAATVATAEPAEPRKELLPPPDEMDFSEPPFIPPAAPVAVVLENAQNGETLIDRVPVGDEDPLPLSAFIGEGAYGGIVRPPAIKRDRRIDLGDNHGVPVDFAALPKKAAPPSPGIVERATLPARAVVVGLLGGIANIPRRTQRRAFDVQPRPLRTKVRGLSYRRERPPFPWINLLLIFGVLALLVVVGLQVNRSRDRNTAQVALASVDRAVSAAETAPSDALAQERLQDAERALGALGPLKQSGMLTETKTAVWGQYQQLLQRYDQARASINHISVFDKLEVVATLPAAGAQASRIVLATDPVTVTGLDRGRMYVLDRGNEGGTVLQWTNGAFQQILTQGQQAGNFNAGKVEELLWRLDNPLAFDRDPNPFNSIATAYLRAGDGWASNRLQGSELLPLGPLPAASFGGNLYLWDSKNQQLMRYASGQYADLPSPWITQRGDAKLDQVVGVQIDGDIYLLQADGSIAVFRAGAYLHTLPAPKLAVPVQTITRFYVSPNVVEEGSDKVLKEGSIFLLDTLNERVIQLRKSDGAVIQQIQARERGPLNRLTDLQVDGARNEIYLANGNQILHARIPNPPAPRTRNAAPTSTALPAATPGQ